MADSYYSIKSDLIDEVTQRLSENRGQSDEEILDYLCEMVDSYTPIYNQDILTVVSSNLRL